MKQKALEAALEMNRQIVELSRRVVAYRALLTKIRRELALHGDDWASLIEEIDEVMR